LYRIVRTATNDDTVTFYVDSNDSNSLGILLEDGEKKQVTRYKLNLLDRDEPDIQLPETEFSTHFTMPSMDFQKICRDMTLLGAKTVEIKNVASSLTFGCKGHFATRTTIMGDSENEFNINPNVCKILDESKPNEPVGIDYLQTFSTDNFNSKFLTESVDKMQNEMLSKKLASNVNMN
jgi:hypothetical protein